MKRKKNKTNITEVQIGGGLLVQQKMAKLLCIVI